MTDSDANDKSPSLPPQAIPDWQRDSKEDAATSTPSAPAVDGLEVARRFLEDDQVKSASREKRAEFLTSKGISDADIQKLLGTASSAETSTSQTQQPPTKATSPAAQEHDQPPIVTYPEFLTKPRRPPPLVTTTRLLNTLYAAASLSALLYGTGKFVLAPMVEALTDARVDMHRTASDKLAALVTQLEATVSEVPSTFRSKLARTAASEGGEEEGDDDDPAEMFHRDVGTQTSDLPAPPPAGEKTPEWQQQSTRVAALTKSLTELKDGVRSQGDSLVDVKVLVDDFRDSLDGLTFTGRSDFSESFDMYSSARKHEPDDEIRKARDNIRRVKGVLLRSRNFPASTR